MVGREPSSVSCPLPSLERCSLMIIHPCMCLHLFVVCDKINHLGVQAKIIAEKLDIYNINIIIFSNLIFKLCIFILRSISELFIIYVKLGFSFKLKFYLYCQNNSWFKQKCWMRSILPSTVHVVYYQKCLY